MHKPVEFLTTDELIDELKRRFHSVLVVRANPAKVDADAETDTWIDYQSPIGPSACLGLAEYARARLFHAIADGTIFKDGSDEEDE